MRRVALALLFALLLLAAPLAAQRDASRLEIAVTAGVALTEGPAITTRESARRREDARAAAQRVLRRAFTTGSSCGERAAFFDDDRADSSEWDVLVKYDPTTQLYNIGAPIRATIGIEELRRRSRRSTSAEAQFGRPYRASLHPNASGRYYYNLTVEVQTLTESDLDALQQWLRGPTAPGTTSNPLTAIRSGLGTSVVAHARRRAEHSTSSRREVFTRAA